ncbi:MAG: protein translocase subunit SecF [Deltaproteobacteria bacterium]|nr:protein translocase subunit SecF [Deltaproteobacteria bacterium]
MTFNWNIPFIRYRFWFAAISAAFILWSFFGMGTKGFNYGIDFLGGAKIGYQFDRAIGEDGIRQSLEGLGLGEVSVVRFGPAEEHRMSIKVKAPEQHAEIATTITATLQKTFGAESVKLEQTETVGPKVGQEMRTKAWLTILVSWALMLIYVGYRFDFYFAPGAIVALVHDVTITLGFFVWMGKEINLSILAALLTIIGYSVNDTIVIFDRIRENRSRITPVTIDDVVNESVNATLSRTIITSLTVLFVVVILFLTGGGTLHDFAFALIVGVIVGSYSTIFIASPMYIALYRYWPMLKARRRNA